jgi:hypothetical protein
MIQKTILIIVVALTICNAASLAINISGGARADVAGMDYRDLMRDRDFRRAVEAIVINCTIRGDSIIC